MASLTALNPLTPLWEARKRLIAQRWRGLVWLTGEADVCRDQALTLWRAQAWQAPLWLSTVPPEDIEASGWRASNQARTRLGGEQDLVVVDAVSAHSGFDPEAFGAVAGTLQAGGLLLLMTPTDWGVCPDADYRRLAEHPWRAEQLSARYLGRLARLLRADPTVIQWPAGQAPCPCRLLEASSSSLSAPVDDPDCLSADQASAVRRLTRLRRRRPLVLTADRGRGKTAALGIACARLLTAGEPQVLITAPRPSAIEGLFERVEALCPAGNREGLTFRQDGQIVRFVAPDALTLLARRGEVGGAGSLLLVDEAAAIPAALLGEWLEAFPRIAFATTVHGYEGSGRGFALRFRDQLERRTPDWQACTLNQPIRWAAGDPLEGLVARLLMLDAEPGEALPARCPLDWQCWSRDALTTDEAQLRSLFGLLVQAHYRTTPADLRRLLDGPGVRLAGLAPQAYLEPSGNPQAVVVTSDEGGFEPSLAERVARGERRPRGHLLAQSLAAHAGSREALEARLRRVVRIAVHPGRRREGLGWRLIEAEHAKARADGLDLLGASFGAEPGLIAFWQSLGFHAVRLGLSRETATGEHALMVVAPSSERGERLSDTLRARFQRQLPGLLAFELDDLAPAVAAALLVEGSKGGGYSEHGEIEVIDAQDRRDIDDVAFAHREPALARPALQALVRHALARGRRPDDDEVLLLIAWAFLGHDAARLAADLGLSSKREATARLRRAVAVLREDLT
ncbi:tRNA(Met) cytidine acetyltransferase [Halomonas sp. TRM85114]|uniref:tRNA(Met) cytidine acetyltransferase TmcA n=1 Tax=Halomonas jincaotanensis TaxID=2810616 RepID=UPI001BD39970|nr:GNAT family N-acetyltransferase [Halomonas jincaotanensis]MBS9403875.1 tRNA(Met) cytidine acetyltransferase [Halomonas jincaotanensis]